MKKTIMIISILLLSGCKLYNPEKEAKEYFYNKWNIECEPFNVDREGSYADSVDCALPGVDKNDEKITITIRSGKGDGTLSDNYFGYYVRNDAENYITNLLNISSEVKAFYSKELQYNDNLNVGNTYEDLLNVDGSKIHTFKVLINKDNYVSLDALENSINDFLLKIKNDINSRPSNNAYSIYIYILDNTSLSDFDRYNMYNKVTSLKNRTEKVIYEHSFYIDKKDGIYKVN